MNPTQDSTRQQPQLFSQRLGEMAATQPRPVQPASRLGALLGRLSQRRLEREEAMDKLKANEFILGN